MITEETIDRLPGRLAGSAPGAMRDLREALDELRRLREENGSLVGEVRRLSGMYCDAMLGRRWRPIEEAPLDGTPVRVGNHLSSCESTYFPNYRRWYPPIGDATHFQYLGPLPDPIGDEPEAGMKHVTVDDIMALDPCDDYSRERVTELWAGRESLTLNEILDLDIDAQDRIWAVARLLPDREARLFAADCADAVIDKIPEGDRGPFIACIQAARDYAEGKIGDDELAGAWAGAWAARAAARAACAGARDAAWDAVRAEQINLLRKYTEGPV